MTSLMKQRFLAGALALGLLATVPAQARNDASAYSALSALPLASVAAVGGAAVAAPVLLSTAGTLLVVKGVQASARARCSCWSAPPTARGPVSRSRAVPPPARLWPSARW
jgi:hypothetical protein